MKRLFLHRSCCFLLITGVLICLGSAGSVLAQEEPVSIADKLTEALTYYDNLDYDKGIEVAESLMGRNDLRSADSVAIYEVLAILTYAKGETFFQQALRYLDRISQVGPCVIPLPRDLWPQELRDRWYRITKEQEALTCDDPTSDVKTIAIMPFDNYSIGEYQEKLGLIAKGISDFFAYDFGKISSFKVIERDKIDYILDELKLQQSGAVDQATAVKAGKILGAKYMVFGSITQMDDRSARMVVRVVSVETSEIVTQVDTEGRPQFSSMEKDLVKDLASRLDVKLNTETLGKIEEGGTDSMDAAEYYAMGLDYMDRYEYKQAYEHFKKAYDLDSSFTEAKRKMEIYRPLAS